MDKRAIEAGARAQTCLLSRPLDYTKDYHGQHQITKMTILEYPHYQLQHVTKWQIGNIVGFLFQPKGNDK